MSMSIHCMGLPDVRGVPVWIYALVDPANGHVRYIGKSASPRSRLASHTASYGARAVREWCDRLAKRGAKPLLVVLYEVPPGEDADAAERRFIAMHLSLSVDLLNEHLPWDRGNARRAPYSWETAEIRHSSVARDALAEWLSQDGGPRRSLLAIADGIHAGVSVIRSWLLGRHQPLMAHRKAVERFTDGAVAADDWRRPSVRRQAA